MDQNRHQGITSSRLTWTLFAASLALHIVVTLVLGHYKNARLWENGGIATHIWQGEGFAAGFSLPLEPTSWQAPGYPYLLVAGWKILGFQSPAAHLAISLLQCLAVASMIFPMKWLALRWFDEKAVLWAQVITVFMPLYFWYPTRLHHTALVMAMHPWLLNGWLLLGDKKPRITSALWTGLGTGIAGLFQPVLLVLFFPLASAKVVRTLARKQWSNLLCLLLAGVLVVAAITPWTIRNHLVHGRLMLIKDSFGKEFWMGNNPHATGTGYAIGGEEEITNAYPPAAFASRGKVREIELMAMLQGEALEFIRENPASFIKLTAGKILWFWTLPPKDRVRSTGDAEALIFRWVHGGYWLAFALLLAIAAIWKRPWPVEYLGILALYVAIFSLIYGLTHVGQARFRGEIEYIFIPAVSAGISVLLSKLAHRIGLKPPLSAKS